MIYLFSICGRFCCVRVLFRFHRRSSVYIIQSLFLLNCCASAAVVCDEQRVEHVDGAAADILRVTLIDEAMKRKSLDGHRFTTQISQFVCLSFSVTPFLCISVALCLSAPVFCRVYASRVMFLGRSSSSFTFIRLLEHRHRRDHDGGSQ